jgi:hypothetical protein
MARVPGEARETAGEEREQWTLCWRSGGTLTFLAAIEIHADYFIDSLTCLPDQTTYADLVTFYIMVGLKNLDGDLLRDVSPETYPAINKLVLTVGEEPRIKGYMLGIRTNSAG